MSLEILALTGVLLVVLWMEDCRQRVLWEVKNGKVVPTSAYAPKDVPTPWLLDPRSLRGVKPHSSERSTGATSAGA